MLKHIQASILILVAPLLLYSAPTSSEQALHVVKNWRAKIAKPLGSSISSEIASAKTYFNDKNEVLYHIVSMKPAGFVVVAGDDRVEPIIAIVADGKYDIKDTSSPLVAMVKYDLNARVNGVRNYAKQSRSSSIDGSLSKQNIEINKAQDRWNTLDKNSSTTRRSSGLSSLADVRVAPLLSTKWDQKGYHSEAGLSYNRYSPQNRYAGCVAIALGQVMRYLEHDVAPPSSTGRYYVDQRNAEHAHRAPYFSGDGEGSAYNWSLMSDGQTITEEASAIAIGRFLFDVAMSVDMLFESHQAGTQLQSAGYAITRAFGYSNARLARYIGSNANDISIRTTILNTNLDASLPMFIGIGGHAVNLDGYGYDADTLYHHINMGWGGDHNAWYNVPDIYTFSNLSEIGYNIYKEGSGEIISGRITDKNNQAVSGVNVVATAGAKTFTASTNAQGIYALVKVDSNTSFVLNASKNGYNFDTQTAQTKLSVFKNRSGDGLQVGNVWGVDFVATQRTSTNITPIADAGADKTVVLSHSVTLNGSASDSDGTIIAYSWMEGSTPLSTLSTFTYTPTSTGTKTLTLTVTDDDGATHSDSVMVTVSDTPVPPTPKFSMSPILYLLQ